MADQTPPITVRVKEIRPCPDGTFNLVLDGAGCDLNFTAEAVIGMGMGLEVSKAIVDARAGRIDYPVDLGNFTGITVVPDQPTGDLRSNVEPPSPEHVDAVRRDTRTRHVVKAMRDLFAENHLAPADAATMWAYCAPSLDWEYSPVAFIDEPGVRGAMAEARAASIDVDGNSSDDAFEEPLSQEAVEEATGIVADLAAARTIGEYQDIGQRARSWLGYEQPVGEVWTAAMQEVISKDRTGTDTRRDVRPSPSRTVAFEDLYPWPPVIRRSDTVYHAVQWVPDSPVINGHIEYVRRFVDEHSICDFTVHHQTTTDRLIVRRHDRSIPITVEALDYLIAEVETGQLFTATPAEYRARFCEAP